MTMTSASAKSARELLALIGDLEQAREGSITLDEAIAKFVGWAPTVRANEYAVAWPPPQYTRSVDAALSLVPDGFGFQLEALVGSKPNASIFTHHPGWHESVMEAHTAALALCIAALRARSAQGTEARRAETAQQAPSRSDDGPVAGGDAPKGTAPGSPLPSGGA